MDPSISSTELTKLLNHPYPSGPVKPTGFLEIIDRAHSETVNSRLYAYFLDAEKNPELSRVFMDALLDLIKPEVSTAFELKQFTCACEVQTSQEKRMDILLHDEESSTAIIIENKIYHVLNNDLADYVNHIRAKNKVLIVLSLLEYTKSEWREATKDVPPDVRCINITHRQWLRGVKQRVPVGLPLNMHVYLNDFINTIEYLTEISNMTPQVEFFFTHADTIIRAKECYEAAYKYIEGQLRQLAAEYNWTLQGRRNTSRSIWNSDHACPYYEIYFDSLLEGKKEVSVKIQMNKEAHSALEQSLEKVDLGELKPDRTIDGGFFNFAQHTYTWEWKENSSLCAFLSEQMRKDFDPVMKELFRALDHKGEVRSNRPRIDEE